MERNRGTSPALVLSIAFGVLLLFSAYVVNTGVSGQNQRWDPQKFPIFIEIWEDFSDDLSQIQTGSDPKRALLKAMDCWVKVSALSIRTGETSIQEAIGDGRNVVTIADTTNNRNIVLNSPQGPLGVSRTSFNTATLENLETDVVFNVFRTFTTIEPDDPASDLIDLLAVAKHEFGHSWNLNHDVQRSSVMHFRGPGFTYSLDALLWDDVVGINQTYSMPGFAQVTGSISGTVTRDGDPVFKAFVVATDEFGVLASSAITLLDGTYKLDGLPSGHDYSIYVEPLDAPMPLDGVRNGLFSSAPGDNNFLPTFVDGTVAVNSAVNGVDVAVTTGNATIDPDFMGTTPNPNQGGLVFGSPATAFQGVNTNFVVAGTGVPSLENDGVDFLGPNLQTGNVARSSGSFKYFPLTVPLNTPQGPYPAILSSNAEVGVITGALNVAPPFRFLQAFAQFAHLAGSLSSGTFLINTDLQKQATGKISARGASGARTRITLGQLSADSNQDLNLSLAPGAALSATTGGGGTFVGSLRASADQCIGGTVLFTGDTGTTGVGPSNPLYTFVAPLIRNTSTGEQTALAITNLEERPGKYFIQVQRKDGSVFASKVVDLSGSGHDARFIEQIITNLPNNFQGTVVVTANRKIGATVILVAPGVFTTFPVVQNRIASRSFYAQFAHIPSVDLGSQLVLVNPSPLRSATVRIRVRSSNGSAPSGVILGGQALPGGTRVLTIPPLGCVVLATGGNTDLVGSVEVSALPADGGNGIPVGGVVLFSSPSLGTAGVGESFALRKIVIPLTQDLAAGIQTGIAAVNTKNKTITLLITVRNQGGGIFRGPVEVPLGASNQLARFPNEAPLSLNLPDKFTGSLWIEVKEADCEVALTVIRQSPGVLTTFPAISLSKVFVPST